MHKKYQFPINIFIVFEKINFAVYTSEVLTPNHYICYIPKQWYYGLNIFLKKELFYNYSFLVEMSAIDTFNYKNIFWKDKSFNTNHRFIQYNMYYHYLIKTRLTFLVTTDYKLDSIDQLYKNAMWLEREVSEMYGLNYLNKKDSRSLLLDYSRNEHPLLKDFPCEGYYEIYFDFFENKINYVKNEFIEL